MGRILHVDDEYDVVEIQLIRRSAVIFAPQLAVEPVDFVGEFFVLTSEHWEQGENTAAKRPFVASLGLLLFYSTLSTVLSIVKKVIPRKD